MDQYQLLSNISPRDMRRLTFTVSALYQDIPPLSRLKIMFQLGNGFFDGSYGAACGRVAFKSGLTLSFSVFEPT